MKKSLIIIILILIAILTSIYIFIPSTLVVSDYTIVDIPKTAAYRYLANENYWTKWWPQNTDSKNISKENFYYNGYAYHINQKYFNNITVLTQQHHFHINSSIQFISLNKDSVAIQWKYKFKSGIDPFKRIRQFKRAKDLKQNISDILHSFYFFVHNDKNIYGIHIQKAIVTDSFLIASAKTFTHYPKTLEIYQIINDLKSYANKSNAKVTNYPMLNISEIDSGHFKARVALPVNKGLNDKGNITYKQFLLGGSIITTRIKGGHKTIHHALDQLVNYIHDHQKVTLAIPYQSLITNRLKVDSSQWVTRVCYPILE